MARLVKNLPAMWETWVRSLDWKHPQEKGKADHSSILAWRIPWTVCRKESDTTERLSHINKNDNVPHLILLERFHYSCKTLKT